MGVKKRTAQVLLGLLRSLDEKDEAIVNYLVVRLLEDQREVLEDCIRQFGPTIDEVRTLAALNEVIDYNTIPGKK